MANMYTAGRKAIEKVREKIGSEVLVTMTAAGFFVVVFFLVYNATYRVPDTFTTNMVIPNSFMKHQQQKLNIPDIINSPVECTGKDYVVLMKSMFLQELAIREAQRDYLRRFRSSLEGNETSDLKSDIQLLFLVNVTDTAADNTNVTPSEEDGLLKGDFVDNHLTLTKKVLMGIQWFVNNCDKKSLLVMADSDVKIDYESLILEYSLAQLKSKFRRSIICLDNLISERKPDIKTATNTYPTPSIAYGDRTLPKFCSSTGYLMDKSTANILVKNAIHTRRFRQDDAYVSGILRYTSGGTLSGETIRVHAPVDSGSITAYHNDSSLLISELKNTEFSKVNRRRPTST